MFALLLFMPVAFSFADLLYPLSPQGDWTSLATVSCSSGTTGDLTVVATSTLSSTNVSVDIYSGSVGSSTLMNGHFHSPFGTGSFDSAGCNETQPYFVVIYDNSLYVSVRAYFTAGTGSAPTHYAGPYSSGAPINYGALVFPLVFNPASNSISTTSSLWSNITVASSSISCNTGNVFSDGFCSAISYLFVPDPQTLGGLFNLASTTESKFPFSWIFGVRTQFQNMSVASSTAMSTLSFNLGSLGIGSTSSMGNILPNTEVFSKNTIETYISPTLWATFQSLIAAALWLLLGGYIFNQARHLAKPH